MCSLSASVTGLRAARGFVSPGGVPKHVQTGETLKESMLEAVGGDGQGVGRDESAMLKDHGIRMSLRVREISGCEGVVEEM